MRSGGGSEAAGQMVGGCLGGASLLAVAEPRLQPRIAGAGGESPEQLGRKMGLRWMVGGILGVLLCASVADAQSAPSIRGRVLDTGGRPVSGVEILLGGVSRTVTTGAAGRFIFDSLDAKEYNLTARLLGYRPARARVAVRAEGPTEVEIRLEEYPQVLDSVIVEGSRRGLYGVVGDSALQPIPGAKVEVFVGATSQRTDSAGRFGYPDIKPGDYLVSASFSGLAGRPRHVTVPRDGAIEVVMFLTPPDNQSDPPGMRWVYHDLGMRLAFLPERFRLTRQELSRYGSRALCDIAQVRAVVADPLMIEIDGIRRLPMWSLCAFSADELAVVELTCSGPTDRPRLSAANKSRCIRVWTR